MGNLPKIRMNQISINTQTKTPVNSTNSETTDNSTNTEKLVNSNNTGILVNSINTDSFKDPGHRRSTEPRLIADFSLDHTAGWLGGAYQAQ